MKLIIIMAGLCILAGPVISQSEQNNEIITMISCESGEKVNINNLGYGRIILKDGTVKKNCILKEINKNWIVYMKDKVLHDMMIDRIKRIEFADKSLAIFFDEKNKPMLKTYSGDY